MALFAKNLQDLMTESISELSQNTNITRLTAGGIARSLLESVNRRIADSYEIFDVGLARAYVSSAPGQFLDLIGLLFGLTRSSSAAANVDEESEIIKFYVDSGTFGDINTNNNINIPQGTLISTEVNNGGISYRTTEDAVLLSTNSEAFVAAEATIPGIDSNIGTNSLIYHNFTSYTDVDNNTLLITNLHPVANGKNFENDENFRYRIVNRVFEAEAANLTAIRLAALTTPGVADVILFPRYKGIGTLGVIIKSILPTVSQNLINSVQTNILLVQALGDIVYVRGPKETGVELSTTIYYSESISENELTTMEETITRSITNYVNNLEIGETFYVNRMVSEIFSIDKRIVNVGTYQKPLEEIYIYKESRLEDNRVRQSLLGDYFPATDERVIMESTIETPITLNRGYIRRGN
jgi:uncharacterized phage protein gp47/JayE